MNNPLEKFQVDNNNQKTQPNQAVEWNDENVFKHIQEKTGREVSSWDDLMPKTPAQPQQFVFANDEVERINKYISETGRSIQDYFESQKDWSKVDNKTLVMGNIREQYPTLTDDEIQELYDEDYGLQESDPEFDSEEEIQKINKQNKRKEIKLKTEAEKVRQKMESLKAQYSQPSQTVKEKQQAAEDWRNLMKNAISEVNVELEDGFKYDFTDKAKYKYLEDINQLLSPFKTSEGGLDYNKLARTIIVGLEHDNVLKEYGKYIKANTVRDTMATASNKSNPDNNPQQTVVEEEWRKIALDNFRKLSNKF